MENLYQPPAASLELPDSEARDAFFVSSLLKATVLYVATFSWYMNYWFYKQWKAVQPSLDEKIMPWARGIFYWFFAHALFDKIAERQQAAGQRAWRYSGMATLIIFADIIRRIFDSFAKNFTVESALDLKVVMVLSGIGLIFLLLPMLSVLAAQSRINALCGDAAGSGNSTFSAVEIAVVIAGTAAWGAFGWVMFIALK